MTFVKTKLKLEELAANDVLEVLLTAGEPLQNLPRTVEEAGYQVVEIKPNGSNYMLVVRVPAV